MKISTEELLELCRIRFARYKAVLDKMENSALDKNSSIDKNGAKKLVAVSMGLLDMARLYQNVVDNLESGLEVAEGKFTISPEAKLFIDKIMES